MAVTTDDIDTKNILLYLFFNDLNKFYWVNHVPSFDL